MNAHLCPTHPGSGLFPVANAETAKGASVIVAAGGSISPATLRAVDEFIFNRKFDGSWDRLHVVPLWVGEGLAAGLMNWKAATPLSNHGLLESDYNQCDGIGPATEGCYLSTGFIPTDHGITPSNLTIGGAFLKDGGSAGYASGTDAGANEGPLFTSANARLSGYAPNGNYQQAARFSPLPLIGLATYDDTPTFRSFHFAAKVIEASYTPGTVEAGGLSTEYLFFKIRRYGSWFYSTDKIGMHVLGESLTEVQAVNLARDIYEFERSIGRNLFQGEPMVLMGDSVASGQGATSESTTWAGGFRAATGCLMLDTAMPNATIISGGIWSIAGQIAQFAALPGRNRLISFGSNDLHRDGSANGDPVMIANYQAEYAAALVQLHAGGFKVMCAGPTYRKDASATKLQAYDDAACAAAASAGVPFLSFYHVIADQATPFDFMADDSHPTDAGYELMNAAALPKWRQAT